jgi:hypothetical protein
MKPPCGINCPDRRPGCHAECEKYQAYREEIDRSKPDSYANADYKSYKGQIIRRIIAHRVPATLSKYKKDK